MNMLRTLGLEKIQVRLLPAEVEYSKYLKKIKFDIHLLNFIEINTSYLYEV